MDGKLIPCLPPVVLHDDPDLHIQDIRHEKAPVIRSDGMSRSLQHDADVCMASFPTISPYKESGVKGVQYLNIIPDNLDEDQQKRLRCLQYNINFMLRSASQAAAEAIRTKVAHGRKDLAEDEGERASYQAQVINEYLRLQGLLNTVSHNVQEAVVDTSGDFHERLFIIATNGISPTQELMEIFERTLKSALDSVSQAATSGKPLQQTVLQRVFICDKTNGDFTAEIWSTTFRLTKDAVAIANGKSSSQKAQIKVHLTCNCFECSEDLMEDIVPPARGQDMKDVEKSLVTDHKFAVEEVKISHNLVRERKHAPPKLETPDRPSVPGRSSGRPSVQDILSMRGRFSGRRFGR